MKRETVHKKIKLGDLVKVERLNEVGIITRQLHWCDLAMDEICYVVFVRGKEVKAYEEGLTVIGET